MKNYLKKLSWPQMLIIVLAILGIGHYVYISQGSFSFLKKEIAVSVQEQTNETGDTIIEIAEDPATIQNDFPLTMTEAAIMKAIHEMSHQKVKSEQKWGAIPLTEGRVSRLIVIVEQNKAKYKNSNLYLEILERWSRNDFSEVDFDHNAIWKLQGGTIGEAKGLLSIEEEREFIEEHFKVEQ